MPKEPPASQPAIDERRRGGNGGGFPLPSPQALISYLVTYELFGTLMYCVTP